MDKTGPWFDVTNFACPGMLADGMTDWTDVIQTAINFILTLPAITRDLVGRGFPAPPPYDASYDVSGTLYFPPGRYLITRSLKILLRVVNGQLPSPPGIPMCPLPPSDDEDDEGDRSNARYAPCSIELLGDATGNTTAGTEQLPGVAVIVASFSDRPALVIQGAQAVRIKNLIFEGKNDWTAKADPTRVATHLADNPYVVAGCRQVPTSPYAGICIDPFYRTALPLPGYPHLSAYYCDGLPSGGVIIENCAIRSFVVGICLRPNVLVDPPTARGEVALTVRDSSIYATKVALSVGQGTSRSVLLFAVSIAAAECAVNSMDYGYTKLGGADCPSLFGGDVTDVKYVFKLSNSGNNAVVSGLTLVRCLSLGQLGAPRTLGEPESRFGSAVVDQLVFKGCHFRFSSPNFESQPSIDAQLFNFARALFSACTFTTMEADRAPVVLHNQGDLTFVNCHFGGEDADLGPSFWITGAQSRASFSGCSLSERRTEAGPVRRTSFGNQVQVPSFLSDDYLLAQALPGSFYLPTAVDEPADSEATPAVRRSLRWVSGVYPTVPLGSLPVQVRGNGSAFITIPNGLLGVSVR